MKTERGLYGLSLITGLIGTVLTLESEIKDSKDDAAVSYRALYAFILWVAGLLWMASRISASLKTQVAPPQSAAVPPCSQSSSPSAHEESPPEKREEKSSVDSPLSDSGTAIALLELKSTPVVKEKEEKGGNAQSAADQEEVAEEITSLSHPSLGSVAILPAPATGWRHRLLSCLNVAHDLIPTAWFAQSLTLFLQNALEESVTSNLLPYTTLSGLTTGYLFCISMKPWQLGGIRRWIENHRNELVIPEYICNGVLLTYRLIKPYFLFAATTASFWTGYNLEELIILITTKLLQRSSASTKPIRKELKIEQLILPNLSTSLLISFGGAACSSLSLLVMELSTNITHQALRNESVLWMSSIGNYAFTYPIGIYLGRYLPHRYHDKALMAATYLLVPFANPELTIPHYLLLMGAGLCGGVAHFILKVQYYRQLAKMQQRKQLTNVLLQDAQSFVHLLPQLSLPNDLLLQQHQQKKHRMTLMIKISLILVTTDMLHQTIANSMTNQRIISLIGLLDTMLIFVGGFYLLPRYLPSVYQLTPLPLRRQFLYRDSFSLIFLWKIALILGTKLFLYRSVRDDSNFTVPLLNQSLFGLIVVPATIKLLCKRGQGYQVYIPRAKDIKQLATALQPEALDQRLKSGETRLSCSYHLLRFIQENPPVLSKVRSLSDNPLENKTSVTVSLNDQLSSSQVEMMAEVNLSSITVSSPSWSPQLMWRPLQGNQSQVKEGKLSVPVAMLGEENSAEAKLTLEVEFDNPHDQSYTQRRLDTSFEIRALDAAIRGPSVVGQFATGLPKGLSLSPDITSFRF